MNLRISVSLIAASALLILQPLGNAQKKVFTPAELAQAQRDAAARAAAAAKKKAARAAAGQGVPAGAPAPAGNVVIVNVTNNTQVSFRAVVAGSDGSPQVVGEIPPSARSGGPTQLQSFPGQQWGFANPEGQIVMGYTATAAAQQRYSIGAANPPPQQIPGARPPLPNAGPPAGGQNAGKVVRLTVQNRWGGTVYASRADDRGNVFNIEPNGGSLTSVSGAQWIFLNENGQEIYTYAASDLAKQTVVLPTPAERQGAIDRNAEEKSKTGKAAALGLARREAFLQRINEGRRQAGARPVKWSEQLANKARETVNYGQYGGFSFAQRYVAGAYPQTPVEVLDQWMTERWEKAAIFFDPRCTAVGYWEFDKTGVAFEYEPR